MELIHRWTIPLTVSVKIQIPLPGARTINSDANLARAIPVADDRQICGKSERTHKSLDRRAIPLTIAIQIKIKLAGLWAKDTYLSLPVPVQSPIMGKSPVWPKFSMH